MNYLYLIRSANNLYKIGYAMDLRHRFEMLYTQSPVELELTFYIKCGDASLLERHLHQEFACKRHHGEWFELSKEDIASIEAQYNITPGNYEREGIKHFTGGKGEKYSVLCPKCSNRSSPTQGEYRLILNCRYCGVVAEFDYPSS